MKKFVYIITNSNRGIGNILHVGLCSDIGKTLKFYNQIPTLFFDTKQRLDCLVYLEEFSISEESAMSRFKELSTFNRDKKIELISSANPDWIDLATLIPA